jgi:hypothetical protein
MREIPLLLHNPPALSDEAASQFLDLLYALTTALENHYGAQLRRRHHADLFEDFDDELPEC